MTKEGPRKSQERPLEATASTPPLGDEGKVGVTTRACTDLVYGMGRRCPAHPRKEQRAPPSERKRCGNYCWLTIGIARARVFLPVSTLRRVVHRI